MTPAAADDVTDITNTSIDYFDKMMRHFVLLLRCCFIDAVMVGQLKL